LQQEGAGASLHALPSAALGLHVLTPLFRTFSDHGSLAASLAGV
jgi:hypothetical protein